jgi:hypothetical protein
MIQPRNSVNTQSWQYITREAAEQVADATLTLLSALVAKSLLRRAETGRYNLHELIRQYAAAQLHSDSQEQARTRTRFSDYYAARLAHWERQLERNGYRDRQPAPSMGQTARASRPRSRC